MSASDTAKEIVRIASTAGLSKDVIDLLNEKVSILTTELSEARLRISHLEIENRQFHTQLDNLHPVGFVPYMGVLWKRTADGFEPFPYCQECPTHSVMTPFHDAGILVCASGNHHAPLSVTPPNG